MQGLGWCCLEELVWGDAAHPWVPPGTLHTRGPGAAPAPPRPVLKGCSGIQYMEQWLGCSNYEPWVGVLPEVLIMHNS